MVVETFFEGLRGMVYEGEVEGGWGEKLLLWWFGVWIEVLEVLEVLEMGVPLVMFGRLYLIRLMEVGLVQ